MNTADLRDQLTVVLAPYPNAKIVDGSDEVSIFAEQSDIIVTTG